MTQETDTPQTTEKNPATTFPDALGNIVTDCVETILDDPETYLKDQRSELLARTFRHFIKVKEETVHLKAIVASVRNSVSQMKSGDTEEIETMLAEQAMILHGTFHYYCEKAQNAYTDLDKMGMALKAQRQYERTIRSLARLQEVKIKELERRKKIIAERTSREQDERIARASRWEFYGET